MTRLTHSAPSAKPLLEHGRYACPHAVVLTNAVGQGITRGAREQVPRHVKRPPAVFCKLASRGRHYAVRYKVNTGQRPQQPPRSTPSKT